MNSSTPPEKHRLKALRWTLRIALLGLAVLLSLGGPLPFVFARLFPALSPLVAISASVAGRTWFLGLFWLLPPLALLALAFWRGRFFCRWMCPAGTLYELPKRFSLKKPLLRRRLSPMILGILAGGTLAGTPVLLFLDPTCTFNRISPLWNRTASAASLVPGLVLPLFLVLACVQPMVWCTHFCPLGFLFELCKGPAGRRRHRFDRSRRDVLIGMGAGIPMALLVRKLPMLGAVAEHEPVPILPPGAEDPETFASLCTRCYACVNICPSRVIRVRVQPGTRLGQLFQPALDTTRSYCDESCNRCSQICHAGAIRPLTLARKRSRQIGLAMVDRTICFAWEHGEQCMICQAVCPYGAIDADIGERGVARPVVRSEICRGCGLCQNECPVAGSHKAITVRGIRQQRQLG